MCRAFRFQQILGKSEENGFTCCGTGSISSLPCPLICNFLFFVLGVCGLCLNMFLSANCSFASVTCIWKSVYPFEKLFGGTPFRGHMIAVNQAITAYLTTKTNVKWNSLGKKKTALWSWWSLSSNSILLSFEKFIFLCIWPRLTLPELTQMDFPASFSQVDLVKET